MDEAVVNEFMSGDTKKVVCGGTSSQIVARCLKTEVRAAFEFPDKDVPPIGYIDGIDLTTEGVLTMRRLLTLSPGVSVGKGFASQVLCKARRRVAACGYAF